MMLTSVTGLILMLVLLAASLLGAAVLALRMVRSGPDGDLVSLTVTRREGGHAEIQRFAALPANDPELRQRLWDLAGPDPMRAVPPSRGMDFLLRAAPALYGHGLSRRSVLSPRETVPTDTVRSWLATGEPAQFETLFRRERRLADGADASALSEVRREVCDFFEDQGFGAVLVVEDAENPGNFFDLRFDIDTAAYREAFEALDAFVTEFARLSQEIFEAGESVSAETLTAGDRLLGSAPALVARILPRVAGEFGKSAAIRNDGGYILREFEDYAAAGQSSASSRDRLDALSRYKRVHLPPGAIEGDMPINDDTLCALLVLAAFKGCLATTRVGTSLAGSA
jgi:hypothetical protein